MKRFACILCLALSAFLMGDAGADEIALEAGPGVDYSGGDEGAFLHYRRTAATLLEFDSYYEFTLGAWNGAERDRIAAAARGLRFGLPTRGRFTVSLGAALLDRTTDNLGTRAQFIFRIGYEHDVGAQVLGVGVLHVSNGSKVFYWEGPNKGENYLVLRIARPF